MPLRRAPLTIVTILFLSIASLTAWIYLLGFRGGFWLSRPSLDARVKESQASVAVVVPARNEAENICASLGSLLAQEYSGAISVLLVDDNSTDGTGAIATSCDAGERLTVISGKPLAAGWSGKLWAVQQGLDHPRARDAEFVLFTDADILHAPGHIAALVARAEADELDMVSEMVRLHCETPAERALIPAFIFFFQMLYPFRWVGKPQRRESGAAGGTMLVRRSTLDRIGGVSAIRHHLIDDCALAREFKSKGGRLWLGHSNDAVSLRIYRNGGEIWNMIARTAYVQLNFSLWMLAGCMAGMGILYCVPPALSIFGSGLARGAGSASWLLMAIAFQPTLRRYRLSPLWGLALPAISMFYLAATVASAMRHYRGRGGGWKDRVYP